VETKKIHLYTFFQTAFFCGVFVIQNIPSLALVFPFMTFLCIPARTWFLPKFFEGWELVLLDGYEEEMNEWIAKKEAQSNGLSVREGKD
jgi:hypothetical protein